MPGDSFRGVLMETHEVWVKWGDSAGIHQRWEGHGPPPKRSEAPGIRLLSWTLSSPFLFGSVSPCIR